MDRKASVFVLGAGWLGMPLLAQLVAQGYRVKASTTREGKLQQIRNLGAEAFVLHLEEMDQKIISRAFFGSEVLILAVPPSGKAPDAAEYALCLEAMVKAAEPDTRVIFLSSTGVYGDDQGPVDESILAQPSSVSGERVLNAEWALRRALGERLSILRLAGLFGPERHPGRWLAGRSDLPGGQAPVNLVHLEDAIGMILRVLEKEAWGTLFNVCADQHPPKKEFYPAMARQLQLIPPTFTDGPDASWKIVGNEKGKRELEYVYKHSLIQALP